MVSSSKRLGNVNCVFLTKRRVDKMTAQIQLKHGQKMKTRRNKGHLSYLPSDLVPHRQME
jgi:hypothetical protein